MNAATFVAERRDVAVPLYRAMPAHLDGEPETYRQWAEGYYDTKVDPAAVRHVYEGRPLTKAVIGGLNSEVTLGQLAADLKEIGYPTTKGKGPIRPN